MGCNGFSQSQERVKVARAVGLSLGVGWGVETGQLSVHLFPSLGLSAGC